MAVVLQWRPRQAVVNGLLQHHLLWSGGLEDDLNVILDLERMAERQRDVDLGRPTEVVPGYRLPPGGQICRG